MAMNSVFEICDTSSDENYFVIGLFESFEKAKTEIEKRVLNNEPISYHNDGNDYEKIEIIECAFGWGDNRKTVFCIERELRLDETKDDFIWNILTA